MFSFEYGFDFHFLTDGVSGVSKVNHAVRAELFFQRDQLSTGEAIEEHSGDKRWRGASARPRIVSGGTHLGPPH